MQDTSPIYSPSRNLLLLTAGVLLAWTPGVCQAQFLRIGPFEGNLTFNLELTFTTNVDGVTDEEARATGLDQEDYYITYGGTFTLNGEPFRDVDLSLSIDVEREEHFIRDDLDDPGEDELLGDVALLLTIPRGRYVFDFEASHEVETERDKEEISNVQLIEPEDDEDGDAFLEVPRGDRFVPGGERQLARDVQETTTLAAGMAYTYTWIGYEIDYEYTKETHNEEFANADKEEEDFDFTLDFTPGLGRGRVKAGYELEVEKEQLLDDQIIIGTDEVPMEAEWEYTHLLFVDVILLNRPNFTYRFGYEREDQMGEKGEWEPIHELTLVDARDLAPNIKFTVDASYTYEEEMEQEDVEFEYGAGLYHQMPRQWTQSLTATREPVDVFASTAEADETEVVYLLTKSDLIFRGVTFKFDTTYTRSEPLVEDDEPVVVEETVDYTVDVSKSWPIPIGRKFNSSLDYTFSYENEEDPLDGSRDEIFEHELIFLISYTL